MFPVFWTYNKKNMDFFVQKCQGKDTFLVGPKSRKQNNCLFGKKKIKKRGQIIQRKLTFLNNRYRYNIP